jgi:hypothetical protein
MILAALVLAAGTLVATDAVAEIRISAVVQTPIASVRIGTTPAGHPIMRPVRPLPLRRIVYRVNRHDMLIAERLGWYTGVPARELLRHRNYGYSWYEIGNWLYVPGRVVRAAMTQVSWDRFLRADGYYVEYNGPRMEGRGRGDRFSVVYEVRR